MCIFRYEIQELLRPILDQNIFIRILVSHNLINKTIIWRVDSFKLVYTLIYSFLRLSKITFLDLVIAGSVNSLLPGVLNSLDELCNRDHAVYLFWAPHGQDWSIIVRNDLVEGFLVDVCIIWVVLTLSPLCKVFVPNKDAIGVLVANLTVGSKVLDPPMWVQDLTMAHDSLIKDSVALIKRVHWDIYRLLYFVFLTVILSLNTLLEDLLWVEFFLSLEDLSHCD